MKKFDYLSNLSTSFVDGLLNRMKHGIGFDLYFLSTFTYYNRLSKTLATIGHDLDLKIASLNLENRCMDVRKKLTVPLARTPNVEGRNFKSR